MIVVVALAVWLLAEGLSAGTANAAPPLMAKDFSKPAIVILGPPIKSEDDVSGDPSRTGRARRRVNCRL